jgi:hypothetical protein
MYYFPANVGGVFLVLGFGCLFALIVAIIEFLWNVKKIAVEEKVSVAGAGKVIAVSPSIDKD